MKLNNPAVGSKVVFVEKNHTGEPAVKLNNPAVGLKVVVCVEESYLWTCSEVE